MAGPALAHYFGGWKALTSIWFWCRTAVEDMNRMSLTLYHDLLARLPISDSAKVDLSHRMAEPWRRYHTRHHLALLWERHQCHSLRDGSLERQFDTLIASAIAFHDAVYVGGARDNESRSAALWLDVSATAEGLSEDDRLWVADTICATADHVHAAATLDLTDARSYARRWMLDLDLTSLGEAPEVFDHNMTLLAAELPHLDGAQQHAVLLSGLRHFATARPLYACAALADTFGESAQNNLRRHLDA